jgi:WS/DGAT/MGAT family acyltransferase
MGNRLSALDTSFLHLEGDGAHMHVAAIMTFEGPPPAYDEVVDLVVGRLDRVPRYRQRLAFVPFGLGRPRWVDDPYFNPRYHIRHAGLPAPGGDAELAQLAARLFGQRLDRSRPLWELLLVEGLSGGRFALISKTHHALVDGISGVDIASLLFDLAPDAERPAPPAPWAPRPLPTRAELLAEALLERTTMPGEIARGVRALTRWPRRAAERLAGAVSDIGELALGGISPVPATPLNVPIGPHRRYAWLDERLEDFRAIKAALGGTINDVVLTGVALTLGRWLRERGHDTDGLVLRAMVPVSVRVEDERGALGNRVAAMWAPLPVGQADPVACHAAVRAAMADLRESGQAVGAERLTKLADFAPPTILSQAARLQPRQRFFNLVITNVPGPQFPLYMLGRRMTSLRPVVPLAKRQALGVAVMSYNGQMHFGLLGDYDALPDLDRIQAHLAGAFADLRAAAGAPSENGERADRFTRSSTRAAS